MNRICILLAAAAVFMPVPSSNALTPVRFQMSQFTGVNNNRAVTITLASDPVGVGTNLVWRTPLTLQPTNGIADVSLAPLNYYVAIDGVASRMFMPVPDTTNRCNAVDLIREGLRHAVLTFGPIAAGNNITVQSNSLGVYTISSQANSDAITNADSRALSINGRMHFNGGIQFVDDILWTDPEDGALVLTNVGWDREALRVVNGVVTLNAATTLTSHTISGETIARLYMNVGNDIAGLSWNAVQGWVFGGNGSNGVTATVFNGAFNGDGSRLTGVTSNSIDAETWRLATNAVTSIGVANVKDWGAKGTGLTNDAPAIQAAVNYCLYSNNSPSRVYFPAGLYRCDQKVIISAYGTPKPLPEQGKPLELFGDGLAISALLFTNMVSGNGLELIVTNSTYAMFSHFALRGLGFWGPLITNQAKFSAGTDYQNANTNVNSSGVFLGVDPALWGHAGNCAAIGFKIEDCGFIGFRNGLVVSNVVQLEVDNCYFMYNWQRGIYGGRFDTVKIDKCTFKGFATNEPIESAAIDVQGEGRGFTVSDIEVGDPRWAIRANGVPLTVYGGNWERCRSIALLGPGQASATFVGTHVLNNAQRLGEALWEFDGRHSAGACSIINPHGLSASSFVAAGKTNLVNNQPTNLIFKVSGQMDLYQVPTLIVTDGNKRNPPDPNMLWGTTYTNVLPLGSAPVYSRQFEVTKLAAIYGFAAVGDIAANYSPSPFSYADNLRMDSGGAPQFRIPIPCGQGFTSAVFTLTFQGDTVNNNAIQVTGSGFRLAAGGPSEDSKVTNTVTGVNAGQLKSLSWTNTWSNDSDQRYITALIRAIGDGTLTNRAWIVGFKAVSQ